MKITKENITYSYKVDGERATVIITPKEKHGRAVMVEHGSTMVVYGNVEHRPSQSMALRYLWKTLED